LRTSCGRSAATRCSARSWRRKRARCSHVIRSSRQIRASFRSRRARNHAPHRAHRTLRTPRTPHTAHTAHIAHTAHTAHTARTARTAHTAQTTPTWRSHLSLPPRARMQAAEYEDLAMGVLDAVHEPANAMPLVTLVPWLQSRLTDVPRALRPPHSDCAPPTLVSAFVLGVFRCVALFAWHVLVGVFCLVLGVVCLACLAWHPHCGTPNHSLVPLGTCAAPFAVAPRCEAP
jgi:hypothetical protein